MPTQNNKTAVIYESLSQSYGHAAQNLDNSVESLFFGLETVISIDDPDVKIELLDAFRDVWVDVSTGTTNALLSSVRRLNDYAVRRSSYDNLNDFIEGQEISISSAYANLSAATGVPIDPLFVS